MQGENEGGVVVYPVMQAYGSLAWEDNSEVDEAVFKLNLSAPRVKLAAPQPMVCCIPGLLVWLGNFFSYERPLRNIQ